MNAALEAAHHLDTLNITEEGVVGWKEERVHTTRVTCTFN
jgi:hypothetical protein